MRAPNWQCLVNSPKTEKCALTILVPSECAVRWKWLERAGFINGKNNSNSICVQFLAPLVLGQVAKGTSNFPALDLHEFIGRVLVIK